MQSTFNDSLELFSAPTHPIHLSSNASKQEHKHNPRWKNIGKLCMMQFEVPVLLLVPILGEGVIRQMGHALAANHLHSTCHQRRQQVQLVAWLRKQDFTLPHHGSNKLLQHANNELGTPLTPGFSKRNKTSVACSLHANKLPTTWQEQVANSNPLKRPKGIVQLARGRRTPKEFACN